MADRELLDPRLTVFVLWGLFIALFICLPSKQVLIKIFQRLGLPCCSNNAVDEDSGASPANDMVSYESLSASRKHEVDSLRSIALLGRLSRFSLTVKEEHMLRRASSNFGKVSVTELSLDNNACDPSDVDSQIDVIDHDEFLKTDMNLPLDEGERSNVKEDENQYTHLMVPYPGHINDIILPSSLKEANNDGKKQNKFQILSAMKDKEGKKIVNESNNFMDSIEQEKRRNVPICCAICLVEYEISDRICYSSNKDCPHVYHEDCIINWLISLGRIKSKLKVFSESPSEAQLLNYKLECPSCRQDFLSMLTCSGDEICNQV